MRLWSIHPQYLDAKGLVALWREALLAQHVLAGKTSGYTNHPQLERFKIPQGRQFLSSYLFSVFEESKHRGYHFDKKRIFSKKTSKKLTITRGQLNYEFNWLMTKLKKRDKARYKALKDANKILPHPLFRVINGPVASWEKVPRR